ncbi:putative uracil phosphoribosyltransferase, partial [Globisporangium splendens]
MTGIQDLLSSEDDPMYQYNPAQRYLEQQRQLEQQQQQQQQQQEQQERAAVTKLPSLSVLMQPPRAAFQQPQAQPAYYQEQQTQQQFYRPHPASPSSPSAPLGEFHHHQHHQQHHQQQQQQFRNQVFFAPPTASQSPQPCPCGCDPVSSDDEMVGMRRAKSASSLSDVQQFKMDNSPSSKSTSSASSSCTTSTSATTCTGTGKKSRYLREMDRRAILARLDKGEKQSVLAKEYQVSRSSICNLYKHRDEVLSRVNQNPFTKHPKKPRAGGIANKATEKLITCVKAIYSPFQSAAADNSTGANNFLGQVHKVNSRAASVLLSIVDKPDISLPEFRRCSNQIMLLLIEEALVMIPTLTAAFVGPFASTAAAVSPPKTKASPICAITMEQTHHAILDVFHSVEPHCPRGYVQFERSQWHQDVKIKLVESQLSSALYNHNVLLLDVAVTSPQMVSIAIESLVRNGALEAKITIVAVFVSREVVEMVQTRFPAVRIILTELESSPSAQQLPQYLQYQERIDASGAMASSPMPRSVLFSQRLEHLYAASATQAV